MRDRTCWRTLVTLWAVALLSGCGGTSTSGSAGGSGPATQSSPVSLSITDAPPFGVTVFSFEVTLNSAVLSPGNVDLLASRGPIRIEVKRLEAEIGFLNTSNVPAGTYTSIQLSFADPELTFRNDTGGQLLNCAAGDVCELSAGNLQGPLVSTINFPAPGLSILGNSPTGLLVDLHLKDLLSSPLGVNFAQGGAATIQPVSLPNQPTGPFQRIDHVTGIVANKDAANSRFVLQTAFHGNFEVRVDSNTRFADFDGCVAVPANFTCVQNDQVVEVNLAMIAGGIFFARRVELEDGLIPAVDHALEGIIFKIDSATQFKMVLVDLRRGLVGIRIGNRVTVTLQNAIFRVDTNGLTVPADLQSAFESATDTSQLMVGQRVQVRMISGPPANIASNRVRLRMSGFTATVSSVPTGNNFNVDSLPGLFTNANPPVTQIQVQTSADTEFEGVISVGELAPGRLVSLRGLLFKGATATPTLVADKVRAR